MRPQPPRQRHIQPDLLAEPRKPKGSPLPILILLALVGAGGYFGWRFWQSKMQEQKKPVAVKRVEPVKKVVKTEPVKTNVVVVQKEPERPREKTLAELVAEEQAARAAVLKEIAAEREKSSGPSLSRFGGVVFGEPVKGEPVRWGTILDGESAPEASLDSRGAAFCVWGPALKKPLLSFGAQPLVWVAPKSRNAYRIEFVRPLKADKKTRHDPGVKKALDYFKKQKTFADCKVFEPTPMRDGRSGCEFVMVLGKSTVTLGEYGTEVRFAIEHEDFRLAAKKESDEARREKETALLESKPLDSRRYKLGGPGRYPRMKFSDATPASFCGLLFGHVAPASAKTENPRDGSPGFFLDFRGTKCPVFAGFSSGRADTDPSRGGVHTIRLFSEGGLDGLNDSEYFDAVARTLESHYKVKAEKKTGESGPEASMKVGDLSLVLSQDPESGGYILLARHEPLAELALKEPRAGGKKRRQRQKR